MSMSRTDLTSSLESLLFISGEPVALARLAKLLEKEEDDIKKALDVLAEKYNSDASCGLMLIMKDGKAVLVTKPENMALVETFTKGSMQENLSRVALEVLSIIAYRAPISRAEIESIRGVNCSFTIRNLLLRDLIERQTSPTDTREYVYFPTFRLLQLLGLQGTQDLPEYKTLSVDGRLTALINPAEESSSEEIKEEKVVALSPEKNTKIESE